MQPKSLQLLEIGFGTGLNTLLTLAEAHNSHIHVQYTAVEAYPLVREEWVAMNYGQLVDLENAAILFEAIHLAPWGEMATISEYFSLEKIQADFRSSDYQGSYDLIYFDAFGPRVQPELWTEEIFAKLFSYMKPNGILVTYSAKGSVRRAMKAAGFEVERLAGPPGKREMLRAIRP